MENCLYTLLQTNYQAILPSHVAIIMDGNGRWGIKQARSRLYGLQEGFNTLRDVVAATRKLNISSLTLFCFSTENWNRPPAEVQFIMKLLMVGLKKESLKLHQYNVRLNIIGDRTRFSQALQNQMQLAEELTCNNDGLILNIAANYGGRWDICQAVQVIAKELADNTLTSTAVDEAYIESKLMLYDQKPVDFMIRTSGEFRISNFLLWQAAYAELYFSDLLWPEFSENDFYEAILSYVTRQRRFGLTSAQVDA